ncbi:MAG: transcription regulator protein, LuxR family [uncultured bacterium]|nr:MAG: transcription regulator protein, LuxR family [uncultured bacterium]
MEINKGSKQCKPSLMITKDVSEICNPLFNKFNLNAFAYSRVFPDGSRSELWSDTAALEHTFINKKYITDLYSPDFYSSQEKYLFLETKVETFDSDLKEKYINQLADQRNHFNHDHSFMIIKKLSSLCEYYIFYAPIENNTIKNTYLNNIDSLETFIARFKFLSSRLIIEADNNKIIPPWRKSHNINKAAVIYEPTHDCFKSALSQKEIKVIELTANGKTAKEVARLLGVSFRTVESHLHNMKLKLNCINTKELIQKYISKKIS